ncbi:YdeI/OmpD-associated family protein [Luteolibacter pohnpeiensis]|uniref:YdeI/OmpD-associated family protein n=1 Tax=Luteolibacter pohnpeiensis TaxID=454153 RepID=A0A934SBI4_9BACT|nr:DUF1801 domain-containing protein [Luteolibacter pohnpeiensis]MBK1884476.1 YdeI/OmpD-associated family protein [Luteolibacter pohnpeiensis]
MNSELDSYFQETSRWSAELGLLRKILLGTELKEEVKWGQPCYTLNGANVIMLASFKDNCAISFLKGVLLKDPKMLLSKPGENSQTVRVIRFTNVQQIKEIKADLSAYIAEAISLEQTGIKVDRKPDSAPEIPDELNAKFAESAELEKAFLALTPGRQRAYCMFFAAAKQSKTRTARIDKYIPQILCGKGMNDCTCGLSKKMPACDGSHQLLKKKSEI